MKRHIFSIPVKLPSLNEVINENRANKYAGANKKKDIESMIMLYIRKAMNNGTVGALIGPCEVYITWHEKTMKRDADNIQSSQKFIFDALQKAGVLVNDNRKYVKQIHHTIIDSDHDGVEVVLHEHE